MIITTYVRPAGRCGFLLASFLRPTGRCSLEDLSICLPNWPMQFCNLADRSSCPANWPLQCGRSPRLSGQPADASRQIVLYLPGQLADLSCPADRPIRHGMNVWAGNQTLDVELTVDAFIHRRVAANEESLASRQGEAQAEGPHSPETRTASSRNPDNSATVTAPKPQSEIQIPKSVTPDCKSRSWDTQ